MSQGGVIGRPNAPTFERASGRWRVNEVFNARRTNTWPLGLPDIGDPFFGGFFAGIIDTNQPGAILPEDRYQTPLRYALIVSPRSLQTNREWRTSTETVAEAQTRWNGLAAQEALTPNTTFAAFDYCNGLPFPDDGGSKWYLPAMDELTEAYWRLKPTTDGNSTGTTGIAGDPFPDGSFNNGELFSSVPQRPPFTSGTPDQTDVTAFQEGGNERMDDTGHWSASWARSDLAYVVDFTDGTPDAGFQSGTQRVRPFRRVVL